MYAQSQRFSTHSSRKGLKLSSSIYLMLIWIWILKFLFENPVEVSKHMVHVPFFHEFQKALTCEHYIEALVKSMAGLSISLAPAEARVKRRLVEIQDSDEEEESVKTPK